MLDVLGLRSNSNRFRVFHEGDAMIGSIERKLMR